MISYILALIILTLVLIGNSLGPTATHISIKYFDSILHLLAGMGLGFFFLGLTVRGVFRDWHTLGRVTLIVVACGVMWELFEIYFDLSGYALWTTMYYLDTVKDLLLDTVGAAVVAYIVVHKE